MAGIDGLEPIKTLIRNLGKQTLAAVGPGRGSSGKKKYIAFFASKLSMALEVQMKNPVVVLTDFATTIKIEGDVVVKDKSFSVAVVAYIDEQTGEAVKLPNFADLEENSAFDYEDFQVVDTTGLQASVLMVLDITARISIPSISEAARNNLRARAKRANAKLYGIVNFGYHIDIYFPDLASMVDATKLTKKPEVIEQLQSDPDKEAGIQQAYTSLPDKRREEIRSETETLMHSLKTMIDPEDIPSLEE